MKNLLLIFGLFVWLTSCKERGVENSYIEFAENQPIGVEEIQEVPENWFDNYIASDSSVVAIDKDHIIHKWFNEEKVSIREKDSFQGYTFDENFVIDNQTNQKMKLIKSNDSLFWKSQYSDTIFNKEKVLKDYKNALIINTNLKGQIYIDVFKKENNRIRKISMGSKEDFKKLRNEIPIEFEYKFADEDTTVVLKPTRADFRKILRKKGLTNEMIFIEQ
ncbi:hypothetical protein [Flavobacterium difficile]|uniref:Lipoprotein n=1 Tax=Flavobacterium difficile TaxID=2709659 RepID=A0ABX0I350_9FLAO|nr:hypothetical protein [Flavobacterium difficile]NHM01614.1 hypothetical protein [Flavobacterium difficile]